MPPPLGPADPSAPLACPDMALTTFKAASCNYTGVAGGGGRGGVWRQASYVVDVFEPVSWRVCVLHTPCLCGGWLLPSQVVLGVSPTGGVCQWPPPIQHLLLRSITRHACDATPTSVPLRAFLHTLMHVRPTPQPPKTPPLPLHLHPAPAISAPEVCTAAAGTWSPATCSITQQPACAAAGGAWSPRPRWTLEGGLDLLVVGLLQGALSYPFFDPVLTGGC